MTCSNTRITFFTLLPSKGDTILPEYTNYTPMLRTSQSTRTFRHIFISGKDTLWHKGLPWQTRACDLCAIGLGT